MTAARTIFRRTFVAALLGAAVGAGACSGPPSKANIELRKQVQALEGKIDALEARHQSDQAAIASLEANATTVPILPQQRVATLFTTHDLRFGRLTGGADLDPQKPGDEAIKVYVVPTDAVGDPLKAAGSFTVRAFDLSDSARPLIGEWSFPLDRAAESWYGQGLLYEYILTCPWRQNVPTTAQLMLRVEFVDALTQRVFVAERDITVHPPPPSPPARTPQP